MMILIRTAFAALVLAAGAGAAGLAQAAPMKQPDGADPAAGAVLYRDNCASCHGDKLQGQPNWQSPLADGTLPAPPHDVTGHTWHHGDDLLFSYVQLGGQVALAQRGVTGFASAMPAFGEVLSDAEIWDILAYLKSNWPARAREMQAGRTAAEQARGN